jgi:signal recognition particle subunit SRP54
MGDVVSFVERAQEQYDQEQAEKLQDKIRSEDFDLQDFYDQLQRIQKMGSVKDLLGMIPGVGSQIKNLDVDDDAFKHIEAMIQSMTPEERAHPEILNGTRRRRIARGSGVKVRDVNQLIKQFREMKKMMKTMSKLTGQGRSMNLKKLMSKFGGGGGNSPFPGM